VLVRRSLFIAAALAALAADVSARQASSRLFRPDDLFLIQRVGANAWSPDAQYLALEFTKPSRWLDPVIPTNDIVLFDVRARASRRLSPDSPRYLGFFNPLWSPDGRRLAFLSVDNDAMVRVLVWTVGASAPAVFDDIDARIGNNEPPIAWVDGSRLAVMAWEAGAEKSGPLYLRVWRGRNVADAWKRAVDGRTAAVSVSESAAGNAATAPNVQLVVLDLTSGARRTLARGRLHRLSVSADGCCISVLRESPGVPGQPVASYFDRVARTGDVDEGYTAVNWGTERHVVDARTGDARAVSSFTPPPRPSPKVDVPSSPPHPDARQLSVAPTGDAALYVAHGADGSRLWIAGGGGHPLSSTAEIWRANEWVRDLKLGRAESFAYTSIGGASLTGWILLPPDYVPGTRIPVITNVYPGTVHGAQLPAVFSPFQSHFEHPQLFAALGYAVLLPSMPSPADPLDAYALEPLLNGVLPAVEALVARGIADPDRIAVLGQSYGGFAALGLITQTTRFRSAIASASYSNLASLYGTFYGQYRYGDQGRPEAAQVLRMLQLESAGGGAMGLGGPPWAMPEQYQTKSPLFRADKVQTPLMLIHGEIDFIPIQQAEEFFTALLRQDKRALLVRYAGEGHTIADRENVLDLWRRLADWLTSTLAPV
jgi:dipeptidyl aminopeptidase/acylaminoacyl peptidase